MRGAETKKARPSGFAFFACCPRAQHIELVLRPAQTNEKGFHFWKPFLFLSVARLAGFEPTTPWFVAKYSIQLSYSRN